jgi:APA family basic amino acid/polyamine antiporter
MLSIGAIVGAGIFATVGDAAAGQIDAAGHVVRSGAGPAIVLSFVLSAFGCALAALCYAELASMIPQAGSAYAYCYATLGELVAWIIGWDLILLATWPSRSPGEATSRPCLAGSVCTSRHGCRPGIARRY